MCSLAAGVLVAVGVTCTLPTPLAVSPICLAAPCDRSSDRPWTNGPRSLIRTTTDLPVSGFITLTCDPSGSVGGRGGQRFGIETLATAGAPSLETGAVP